MASKTSGNTVYLTEEEVQRIQRTVQDRLAKCSSLAGHAREPRDERDAVSQATGASLMADMGGASQDALPALAVGQPYPPCAVSAGELQPMKMAELRVESHHRGTKIAVERVSPVVMLAARSWTMVKDEDGEIERLEICLHKSRHGEDVLDSAKRFVLKEPYFTLTEDGEPTIRVDHPSDLIVCNDDIEKVDGAGDQTEDLAAAEKKARTCKDKGNAALQQKDLPLAHASYSEGIKIASRPALSSSNPDLARDIYRNRAHVNLLLNQLDEAKSDALASLTGGDDQRCKDLDSKAYYRAGLAAYRLGEYKESKDFFTHQQNLAPGGKDIASNLRKIDLRTREQETGVYNFPKIKAALSPAHLRVDAANFTSLTKIDDSPGRGRGLFATRDIAAGELVMCEKALCVVWGHEPDSLTAMTYDIRDEQMRVSPVGLTKSTVQQLLDNPSQIQRVTDLFGDYRNDSLNPLSTADGPVVDTFQVHDIISRNAFGAVVHYALPEGAATNPSTGIWVRAAYINHSCLPNTEKESIGDLMIVRATQRIPAGAELFHSYDSSVDFAARQAKLKLTWGFECKCELCEAERADEPSVRERRMELAGEADAFLEREGKTAGKGGRVVIAKAKRIKKLIDETYDEKRYKNLPRLAGAGIRQWLGE